MVLPQIMKTHRDSHYDLKYPASNEVDGMFPRNMSIRQSFDREKRSSSNLFKEDVRIVPDKPKVVLVSNIKQENSFKSYHLDIMNPSISKIEGVVARI